MRLLGLVGLLWVWAGVLPVQARSWRYLDGMELEESSGNDGDSFHTKRKRTRYVLRLYFVDSPETDDRFPERVKEQAEYFGVTPAQAVAGGKKAVAFTNRLLAEKPFEVWTKYLDAQGSTRQGRIFAMVKVGDRWLCELLVEAGLARIYGVRDELPDGTSERLHLMRLRALEKEAKREKRGLWGANEPAARVARAGGKMVLDRPTPIFSTEPPHRMVGQLPSGWEVTIGGNVVQDYFSVTFVSQTGVQYTGLIHAEFVPGGP